MTVSEFQAQIQDWPVEKIDFFSANVNQMNTEQYAALREDMRVHGRDSIDPITCCRKSVIYPSWKEASDLVVLNGNHRLKAAMELGWRTIPTIIDDSVKTEEDARVLSYRKNAERGGLDPFKEAETYKWFIESKKLKQEDVAKKFGVDQSTVAKRIGLLKLAPSVVQVFRSKPSVNVSAAETLTALPQERQEKVLKEAVSSGGTVRDFEWRVQQEKREIGEENKLQKALADPESKFKKCPKCKKDPVRLDYRAPWVECASYHTWSLKTGKADREYSTSGSSSSSSKSWPQHIKSPIPTKHYAEAIRNFFAKQWAQVTDVDTLSVWGKVKAKEGKIDLSTIKKGVHVHASGSMGSKQFQISVNTDESRYGDNASVELIHGLQTVVNLSFRENKTANDSFETYAVCERATITSQNDLNALEEKARDFLSEYGSAEGKSLAKSTIIAGGKVVQEGKEEPPKKRGPGRPRKNPETKQEGKKD